MYACDNHMIIVVRQFREKKKIYRSMEYICITFIHTSTYDIHVAFYYLFVVAVLFLCSWQLLLFRFVSFRLSMYPS